MHSAKRISRRMLLRSATAAIALPMLDVMTPARNVLASSATAATNSPVRLAWVFFPNGTNADQWLPKANGDKWDVVPSLEPLAKHHQHITAFRGLAQMNGNALGDGPGDHARSAATFLTGVHPLKTAGSQIKVGRSVDQVLADHYGQATRLPSIELGTEEGRQAGDCDSGYSCAYSNNISWRSESQPMSKEVKPANAFRRLFGGHEGPAAPFDAVLLTAYWNHKNDSCVR